MSGQLLGKDPTWFFSRKRFSPGSRRILGGRLRKFDSFVVCKGQIVKISKLRTRLGLAVVCWDEPVLVQFV